MKLTPFIVWFNPRSSYLVGRVGENGYGYNLSVLDVIQLAARRGAFHKG